MIDFLRNWLMGITAAAIILGVADCLMPESGVKRIGKFAGGLFLMLAIIRPVLSVDYDLLAGTLANYRVEVQSYGISSETENERLKKIIIEDRTGAYIRDKANELGIDCLVAVECRKNEEGLLYPWSVTVSGDMTQEQIEQLTWIIESEIAILPELQHFERTIDP